MGHYCRICGQCRSNETFNGKGHKSHICKDCQKLPQSERDSIECHEELSWFLEQSRISKKNKIRLKALMEHDDKEIRQLAELVYDVACLAEGKKRRWAKIKKENAQLYHECFDAGLIWND